MLFVLIRPQETFFITVIFVIAWSSTGSDCSNACFYQRLVPQTLRVVVGGNGFHWRRM